MPTPRPQSPFKRSQTLARGHCNRPAASQGGETGVWCTPVSGPSGPVSDRIFGPSRCRPPPHRTPRRHQSTEQAANSGSGTIDTCQVGFTAQEGRSPHGNVWQGVHSVHPQPPPSPWIRCPLPALSSCHSGRFRQHPAACSIPAHPCTPLTCAKPRSAGVGGGAVPPEAPAWG